MEPSGRNRWQPVANGTRSKTAQTGRSATGKEGVDGSSPSEGFDILPAQLPFLLPRLAADGVFDVHSASTAWTSAGLSPPNMSSNRIALTPVSGEMAVVAVDHGQARSHVARELEG
jgi:hypothetical protein